MGNAPFYKPNKFRNESMRIKQRLMLKKPEWLLAGRGLNMDIRKKKMESLSDWDKTLSVLRGNSTAIETVGQVVKLS